MIRAIKLLRRTWLVRRLADSLSRQAQNMKTLLEVPGTDKDSAFSKIVKTNLYVILFLRDLQFALNDTLVERNAAKKNYYARQLIVVLVDFIDKSGALLNQGLRQGIGQGQYPSELKDLLSETSKLLSKISSNDVSQLRQIRNTIAAHRDLDSHAQLRQIEKTDIDFVCEVAHNISYSCHALMVLWPIVNERLITKGTIGVRFQ